MTEPIFVPVALLGYGTVGAQVNRLLTEQGDEIERATGHRLYVKRALVRSLAAERSFPAAAGVLTTDFSEISNDSEITLVAEMMGGVDAAADYVLALLASGRSVASANKQLVARRWDELFVAAKRGDSQLRFEASTCAAIPVIKVLRESLVSSNVHRVLGIVNGTTNFMLTRMEGGLDYATALKEAQALGYAEADPHDDVSGLDAAAKMAILATVAFGAKVAIEDVHHRGIEELRPEQVASAADLGCVIRLIGQATLLDDAVDVRVAPTLVSRHHPLAAVEGATNAVLIQGDAIKDVLLEGPGAGGVETASAIVADLVSILGSQPSFLQDDPCWRVLPSLPAAELSSPYYLHLRVRDQAGILAEVTSILAEEQVSVSRLTQRLVEEGADLDLVTHAAATGRVEKALERINALEAVEECSAPLPVLEIESER